VSAVKVGDVMTKRVMYAITPRASVAEAAKKMKEVQKSCLLVMNGARPVGIISETDIVQKVLAESLSPADLKVSEVMSKELRTIGPDESVSDAAKLMEGKKVRRLVVTEGVNAVGIVTTTDLARLLVG
jgi:CBS domain-containing protein